MDAVCEHCGSRVCLKAEPKRCRHTGLARTVQPPAIPLPVGPAVCEHCGSRMCAKASPMKCRHTGIERFPVFGEPTGVVIEDEKVDEPKGDETETETEEAPKAPTQKPAGSTGRRR